ncbi:hypothetical protein [Neptunomonas antarctica]|uniref:Uncharacterized protein n=1 Tax=Neptunomonas antarctica TaxID=619304 RepID=A0A1N7MNB6_9GAMM|nr:hypothetical protein [Neptunomonas antarctica]SIS87633.1 hypothetical protein SAMN05421760_106219 [Neptunomonas antarctica]
MSIVIKQGESFSVTVTPRDDKHREYNITEGVWECWLGIYDADGGEYYAVQVFDIADSDKAYIANVETSVTAALLPRKYIMAIKVKRTDSTPALSIESHGQITIQKGFIN